MTEKNSKEQDGKPAWHKPRLERIGTIRDIALSKNNGGQAANGKFS